MHPAHLVDEAASIHAQVCMVPDPLFQELVARCRPAGPRLAGLGPDPSHADRARDAAHSTLHAGQSAPPESMAEHVAQQQLSSSTERQGPALSALNGTSGAPGSAAEQGQAASLDFAYSVMSLHRCVCVQHLGMHFCSAHRPTWCLCLVLWVPGRETWKSAVSS